MSQSLYTVRSTPQNAVLPSLWSAVLSVGGGFNVYLKLSVLVTWQLAELEKHGASTGWYAEIERDSNYIRMRTEVSIQAEIKHINYPDWFMRVFSENSIIMMIQDHKWELTVRCSVDEIPYENRNSSNGSMSWESIHTDLQEYLDHQLGMEQEIKDYRQELLLTNQGIVALVEELEGHYGKGTSEESIELQFDERVKENRLLIERLREKELALQQADRLASVGQLVAGVAHEINNPLTFIRMNLELMTRYHDLLESKSHAVTSDMSLDLSRAMKAILSGVERISNIVAGLKYFSRQQAIERKEVNLAEVISSAWMLISSDRTAISGITLDYQEVSKILVYGSYQQLEQVFVNFLQNATRAINKVKRSMGIIRISVRQEEMTQGWVLVDVQDNGCGIDSKEIPHIFEPFYSKDPEGMGLGLSIVHGIVKDHSGHIAVASELGEGTRITLRLPSYNPEPKLNLSTKVE
ncbi:sensor histidine kinase [Desulfosporosinus hippei]|uniref:histidine kinase n=1 Tax=Desulfosporosinus hippei DSM 8344 TaxID=1121419 RepID=A0A1G7WB96_9FIRM|nr:ATP-binding protein [Desulfosporosinus hippei]SDG69228.1 His Kinase A (phospho-acceptor) domain-containing protein [Desulfosporosinus hippei DSM 8344]